MALERSEKRDRIAELCYRELRAEFIRAITSELGSVIESPAFNPPRQHLQDVVAELMANDATILRRLLDLLRAASASEDRSVKTRAHALIASLAHWHADTHCEEAAANRGEPVRGLYGLPD